LKEHIDRARRRPLMRIGLRRRPRKTIDLLGMDKGGAERDRDGNWGFTFHASNEFECNGIDDWWNRAIDTKLEEVRVVPFSGRPYRYRLSELGSNYSSNIWF
jgi:hypothetical protein